MRDERKRVAWNDLCKNALSVLIYVYASLSKRHMFCSTSTETKRPIRTIHSPKNIMIGATVNGKPYFNVNPYIRRPAYRTAGGALGDFVLAATYVSD